MNSEFYKQYLQSQEWMELRRHVRARCRGRCEHCAIARYQETHHLTYARLGNEKLEDLQAVCSPCHRFLSGLSQNNPANEVAPIVLLVNKPELLNALAFVSKYGHEFLTLVQMIPSFQGVRFAGTTQHIRFWKDLGFSMLPAFADSRDEIIDRTSNLIKETD